MKLFLKRNKVTFVVFLILLAWICSFMIPRWKNKIEAKNHFLEIQEKCKLNPNTMQNCQYYIEKDYQEPSVFVEFSQAMQGDGFYHLQILAPLIIIIVAVSKIHSKLKTGYLKNELQRMSYKTWWQKNLKEVLSVIWILPVFVIIVFLICYFETGNLRAPTLSTCHEEVMNGTIEKVCSGEGLTFLYGERWIPILPTFSFIFLLNIILNSIFYVNLSLLAIRKNKNVVVSIIVGYLTYIVCNLFLEVLVGGLLFSKTLGIRGISAFIGLSEYWVYENKFNIWLLPLYYLCLIAISYLVVKWAYRKKEDIIIENEK